MPSPSDVRAESASVKIDRVDHGFHGATVLNEICLDVNPGEFLTLLGPSGSGKTTLLRLIAGMMRPDSGRIHIDARDVTTEPMHKREIGFVFQNYALFPHLNVFDNVAFGLDARGFKKSERAARVDEVLSMVQMENFADRLPAQMSGGQQQRVSVARALAANPRVLLMDEPLGALDRRLRDDLQGELRRLQREVGTTTIYVTHDQDEAFTMSDRVAVMNRGVIEQFDDPESIYRYPRTPFVARFVGDINAWTGEVLRGEGERCSVRLDGLDFTARNGLDGEQGTVVDYMVRPEAVRVRGRGERPDADLENLAGGTVELVAFFGNHKRLTVRLSDRLVIGALVDPQSPWGQGAEVSVSWSGDDAHAFIHHPHN